MFCSRRRCGSTDKATDKVQCSSCLCENERTRPTFLSPASAPQEYDRSLRGHTGFRMKCAVSEFNHSVIQNTITVHTWAYVIILQEKNGNNTELAANPLWRYCSVSRGENQVVFLNSKIKQPPRPMTKGQRSECRCGSTTALQFILACFSLLKSPVTAPRTGPCAARTHRLAR